MQNSLALKLESKIYIAGHSGLAGSAIWSHLDSKGFQNLIGWRSSDLDLRDGKATIDALSQARPDFVIIAAAKVGGIAANYERPVEFLLDNLKIQNSIIEASHITKVPRLLFLGSSCIYPKYATKPIREDSLLTGELEPTNEPYAIAKIAGVKLIQSYRREYGYSWISAMPTNLYGPGDNYDSESSHVLAAFVRKFTEAARKKYSEVTLWGSGSPRREFLYSQDLATATLKIMEHYDSDEPINIGSGVEVSIKELAAKIAQITGFDGKVNWDMSKPDGTPRKLLDSSKLKRLGWRADITLDQGLKLVCAEYSKMAK